VQLLDLRAPYLPHWKVPVEAVRLVSQKTALPPILARRHGGTQFCPTAAPP
jgi:hypothetical protein